MSSINKHEHHPIRVWHCRAILQTQVAPASGEAAVQSSNAAAAEPALHMRCFASRCTPARQPDATALKQAPRVSTAAAAALLADAAVATLLQRAAGSSRKQLATVSIDKASASGEQQIFPSI